MSDAQVLKHLLRAGHDRMGNSHVEYPEPGTWDLVIDKPGCDWGLWLLPDGVTDADEEEAWEDGKGKLRVQCNECTCGYSDVLNLFQPGEEERARVEENAIRDQAEQAVANQHQLEEWDKANE